MKRFVTMAALLALVGVSGCEGTRIQREDPKGRPYYWIGGDPPAGEPEAGTDIGALARGYVSVTPLNLDMTDQAQLSRLIAWGLQL